MENLLFSINSTLPIFLLILLGYGLKRAGILEEGFVKEANRFNYIVTLPVLLFRDLMEADVARDFDLGFVLFCAAATTVSFFVLWFLSRKLLKNKLLMGEFVQASFRCSAAVMGVAFVQNMYGDSGMAPMMIIGTVPLLNVYSVLVLTFEAPEKQQNDSRKMKEALFNIMKNPIIIAIILGCAAALVQLKLPVILQRSVGYVAGLATPLALICLGAGFEAGKALEKIKPTLWASCIKLILLPCIFVPIAVALGYRHETMTALLVMLAAPTTPSCYIMAKNMGYDGFLTSGVVAATTFLASITLTGWIFLLKMCQVL